MTYLLSKLLTGPLFLLPKLSCLPLSLGEFPEGMKDPQMKVLEFRLYLKGKGEPLKVLRRELI